MSRAQREKGKRGERLWRDELRGYGFAAERAGYKQAHFGAGGADVEDNTGWWPEVKFVESLNVRKAYEQAEQACPIGVPPYVAHKTSAKPWLATLAGSDFLRVLAELRAAREKILQMERQLKEVADPTA